MNKKGFTLFEMLCVLFILCLLFLITVPMVNNIIKQSKQGTNKDSILGYIRAINNQVGTTGSGLDNTNSIKVPTNHILETGVNDIELGILNISGMIPDYVKITFDNTNTLIESGNFCINDKSYDYTPSNLVESTNDYCQVEAPGLYNLSNTLIASWNTLVNTYGLKVDIDYTYNTGVQTDSSISTSSGKNVLLNQDLAQGIKLVIPEGVTYIGVNSFRDVTTLQKIVFPKSLKEIGNYAFRNDSNQGSINSLVFQIKSQLERIGRTSFMGNINLEEVFIPKSVKTIDGNAFRGMNLSGSTSKLKRVVFGFNSELETIGDSAFSANFNLKAINFPSRLKVIDDYAFQYCIGLKEIIIPSSVTKIGDRAFEGYELDSTYPDGFLMTIKKITFEPNSNLEYIGEQAFYYNEVLTTVTIPAKVKTIGAHAFSLPNLKKVEFETTTGWYYTNNKTATSGTSLDVSDSETNAYNFRSNVGNNWIKRN